MNPHTSHQVGQEISESEQISIENYLSDQSSYDPSNKNQVFYRTYSHRFKDKVLIKHNHKIFTIGRQQQDLMRYCMSLFQAEIKFPVRVSFRENDEFRKDVWVETDILLRNSTVGQQSNQQVKGNVSIEKNRSFEVIIYRFFTKQMIPLLKKFKERRMQWDYMTSEEYNDENVINEFKKYVTKRCNEEFKKLIK